MQIFILTGFIVSILLETKEEEPPPSGLDSPQLIRYIIMLSFLKETRLAYTR